MGVEDLAAHGVDLAGRKQASQRPPVTIDEWDFDHDLRELAGLVSAAKAAPLGSPLAGAGAPAAAPLVFARPKPAEAPIARPRGSLLAWCVLLLGVVALAGGGSLLALAYVVQSDELWSLGMPITIAGQVSLLLGLVLQLERVWRDNRYAVDKLGEVDRRLADLNQATTMLGVTHGSASQAFYAHMAEGASPHLLLADLKGQLDLLAVRMSERR